MMRGDSGEGSSQKHRLAQLQGFSSRLLPQGSQHQQEPVGRTSSAAADGELLAGAWPEYSHESQAQKNTLILHKSKL